MIALTQREILEVLISLGITSVVDLKVYSKEYALYFNREYPQISVPHK